MAWNKDKIRRAVRAPFECLAVLLGFLTIPLLPRTWVVALSDLIGWTMSRVCVRQTRIMAANLDLVYGDSLSAQEKRAIIRGAGAHGALVLLDFFWFAWFTRKRILKYVTCCDTMKAIIASDTSVFLFSSHFGNWELAAQFGAVMGRRFVSIFAPLGTSLTQTLLFRVRTSTGADMVPRKGAMLSLLKAVREGALLCLLLDQRVKAAEGGIFVNFMGKPALLSSVAGVLSKRRQVPLALTTAMYLSEGRVRVQIEKILPGDCGLDETAVTQWVADAMEEQIKRDPSQWFWMYRRWRDVAPDDDAQQYPFYARD